MVCKNNFLKDVSQGLPRGMTCTSYLSKMASQGHGLQKPLFESGFPRARLAKTTFRKWFPKGCPRAWPAKTTFRKWFPKGMACKNHFSKVVSQGLPRGRACKNHFAKEVSQGHGLQKPPSESGFPGASQGHGRQKVVGNSNFRADNVISMNIRKKLFRVGSPPMSRRVPLWGALP